LLSLFWLLVVVAVVEPNPPAGLGALVLDYCFLANNNNSELFGVVRIIIGSTTTRGVKLETVVTSAIKFQRRMEQRTISRVRGCWSIRPTFVSRVMIDVCAAGVV
jgi:hypothetical protein